MTLKTYTAKTAINHNKVDYAEGDPIELDDKIDAPALIAVGAIDENPVKKAAAKSARDTDSGSAGAI